MTKVECHAQGLVHICQRRSGHGQVGADHLGRKVGRVDIIEVDDFLKDAAVDDSVRGALLGGSRDVNKITPAKALLNRRTHGRGDIHTPESL